MRKTTPKKEGHGERKRGNDIMRKKKNVHTGEFGRMNRSEEDGKETCGI